MPLSRRESEMQIDLRGSTIVVVSPGGLEHGGGIGRQMGYFLEARQGREDGVAYRVVDSRGPWFLGSARLYTLCSGLYLADAILKLLYARLTVAPCLAHINVTGRAARFVRLSWRPSRAASGCAICCTSTTTIIPLNIVAAVP